MGQKELLSALRKMTIIIRPVYNHQKSPVRDTRNVTKTLFLVWESQKRVKCMSFTCGGKDGCRWHVESKSHLDFEMLKMTQKPLSSFCETAEHDRTWAVTKAEAMMCQPITALNLLSSSADLFSKYFNVSWFQNGLRWEKCFDLNLSLCKEYVPLG